MDSKTGCDHCGTEAISRFADGELDRKTAGRMALHIETCPECRRENRFHRNLDQSFRESVLKKTREAAADFQEKYRTENSAAGRERPLTGTTGPPAGGFRFTFPLKTATIAAILLGVALVFTKEAAVMKEPSAIVNSIDSTGSSVLVFETVKKKHTVIWFSEKI